jgi:hypothetical protein
MPGDCTQKAGLPQISNAYEAVKVRQMARYGSRDMRTLKDFKSGISSESGEAGAALPRLLQSPPAAFEP